MERRHSKRKIAQRGRVRCMAGLAVRVGASYGRLALARALGRGVRAVRITRKFADEDLGWRNGKLF
jgi:hypothetical protein